MDVGLNEMQRLLRDSLRDYLSNEVPLDRIRELEANGDFDHILWDYLRSAGVLALPFPEEFGGEGGELTDLAVALEELTRRAAVVPFMETMTSALALQRHGDRELAQEIVAGVVGGAVRLSPAIAGPVGRRDTAAPQVSGGTISGEIPYVDYGGEVTHHLVEATDTGETALYLVDAGAEGLSYRPLSNIGRTPQADVTYRNVQARKAGGAEALVFLRRLARLFAAVQCCANAQQALDMSVEYVAMRVQFGRPIGSFQAVQHHCANMATMALAARFLCYSAIWNLDRGAPDDRAIAKAKLWASRTATEVPMLAHNLHGGIGYTEEYGLHFFSRHGKERALAWGSAEECLEELAASLDEIAEWA